MSLSWINFVTSGNIGFASVRDGPLQNLWGEGGRRSRKKKYSRKGKLNENKSRRKAIFNWAAKGLFFLRGGGGYTNSATIKPCRRPLHATESDVRLKHKLIQNIVPFWKTFVTKKKSTIFKWGLYNNFEIPPLWIKINKLAIILSRKQFALFPRTPPPIPLCPKL